MHCLYYSVIFDKWMSDQRKINSMSSSDINHILRVII